jgi:CheY-like chemotaxis protein
LLPAAAGQPAIESRRLPDARILILEGPRSGDSILQRHLKSWGLRSVTVVSGPETLAALRAEHFDAALIDMQVTGVDAASLLREIAADSSLNSTPILRLTPIGGIPQGNAARTVHKPVKPAILFDALQRILQPASCPQAPPAAAISRPVPARRGRVLIAEDNIVNQRVARLQVGHCGFEADVVGSGEEALAALAQMSYALVLMDCQMPGMDGYAATRELRRLENGASHVPVIALTANAFAADREACMDAGMDDHLSKPVSLRDLAAVLDRWADIAGEA